MINYISQSTLRVCVAPLRGSSDSPEQQELAVASGRYDRTQACHVMDGLGRTHTHLLHMYRFCLAPLQSVTLP